MKAYECAKLIHNDFEKRVIMVEVFNHSEIDFTKTNPSIKKRHENKNYLVKDGDICFFIIKR
jgi:ribosome-binding ATPase YchF (GTP1/OBG family)